MAFILGKKVGMSQIFAEDGTVTPVTVISVEPNVVVQVKSKDKDGYEAVQLGAGTRKEKNIARQQRGHFKNLGNFAVLKEFNDKQQATSDKRRVGDKFGVEVFEVGEVVKVSGLSKGKGFQGVVKRHGFKGMPRSHGHRSVQRHAGSIGQRFPQHTLKGMRMPGRMGGVKRTTRGLKVMKVDLEKGVLAVKGAVPGNRGGLVVIQTQK